MIIATYVDRRALEALKHGDILCHRSLPRPAHYIGPFYRPQRATKFIPGQFVVAPNWAGTSGYAMYRVTAVGSEGGRIVVHLA